MQPMPQHVWQLFSNMMPELGMIFLMLHAVRPHPSFSDHSFLLIQVSSSYTPTILQGLLVCTSTHSLQAMKANVCASSPLVGRWTWWSLRRKHLSFHCLSTTAWHQHQPVHEKRGKTSAGLQRKCSLEYLVLPALETPIWVKTLQSKSLPVKLLAVHDISNISCASKLYLRSCCSNLKLWAMPTVADSEKHFSKIWWTISWFGAGAIPLPSLSRMAPECRGNSNRV